MKSTTYIRPFGKGQKTDKWIVNKYYESMKLVNPTCWKEDTIKTSSNEKHLKFFVRSKKAKETIGRSKNTK